MRMNKERFYHADVVRIVACMMVVLMHSPMPGDRLMPMFTSGLTYFTMPCIGLFFTLSGFLLLPVKTTSDSFKWTYERIKKFIVPLVIWTFIYLLVNGTLFSGDVVQITKIFFSIPFSPQGHGVLWFMYVLIGLYFVAPVISPWLQETNKKTLQCYLTLWGVSLLFPYLEPFINIRTNAYGVLYYMSGFLGYFFLGFYLRHYGIKMKPWKALYGIFACMGIYALYRILDKGYELGFEGVFWYLSIDSPLLVVFWWNLLLPISSRIKSAKESVRKLVVTMSNLSFGVYLAHVLVMRYGLWKLWIIQDIHNYVVQTIVVFMLSMLGTLLLVYAISLTPFSKYIISYKKK